jgi:hypothetical protein
MALLHNPALLVFASLSVLGAQSSCGKGETVNHRFELASCPAASFTLPATLAGPEMTLQAVPSEHSSCAAYTGYRGPGVSLDAGVARGSPCSVNIGYRVTGTSQQSSPEDLRRIEAYMRVHDAARLIAREAGVALREGDPTTHRFASAAETESWCAKRVGDGVPRRDGDVQGRLGHLATRRTPEQGSDR